MSINRIYCIGDGFAHGHIWPEWPQILKAILPHIDLLVISGVGAGNEFLLNGLLQHNVSDQTVIFQWANCQRFDKLIEDNVWHQIGQQDPVYHFNFYKRDENNWWLSSSSNDERVRLYHNFYVQSLQAQLRMHDQKKLLHGYLDSKNCKYLEISTDQQERYSRLQKFASLRGNEVQPSPIVHFDFVMEEIMPHLEINYNPSRAARLRELITHICWVPYDADREEIWKNTVDCLDNDIPVVKLTSTGISLCNKY